MIRLIKEQAEISSCIREQADRLRRECGTELVPTNLASRVDNMAEFIRNNTRDAFRRAFMDDLRASVDEFCRGVDTASGNCREMGIQVREHVHTLDTTLQDIRSRVEEVQGSEANKPGVVVTALASLIAVPMGQALAGAVGRFALGPIKQGVSRYIQWVRGSGAMHTPLAEWIYIHSRGANQLEGLSAQKQMEKILQAYENSTDAIVEDFMDSVQGDDVQRQATVEIVCPENNELLRKTIEQVKAGEGCTVARSMLQSDRARDIRSACPNETDALFDRLQTAVDEQCGGCERLAKLNDRAEQSVCNEQVINEIDRIISGNEPDGPACQREFNRGRDLIARHDEECN